MKKSFLVVFLSFFLTSSYVSAENSIAVVDLQKIVSNSNQVKQLKRMFPLSLLRTNHLVKLSWILHGVSMRQPYPLSEKLTPNA